VLLAEEAYIDEIYRRQFFCPENHLLWIALEDLMGEIGGGEFG
jgi:hypothetical protein